VVIVGGGRAGVAAAEELRQLGFPGRLSILCDEPDGPYDRTACSKGLLNGRQRPADVALPIRAGTNVEWLLGRAVELDPFRRCVYTQDGREIAYDGLVIASGARPFLPPTWPYPQPGLHMLHGLSDAWALRHDLRSADRVAVVGGGLTGCETAYTVRSLARKCVLIDSHWGVMTRAIGDVASEFVTDEVAHDGVEMRLGRRVKHVEPHRRGWCLTLDDGTDVYADLVVATLGERPNTEWLRTAGPVDISDGVLCDESLRVVGLENVVAAGVVARWPNTRYDAPARRTGQWIAALEHGHAAARTLLAGDQMAPSAAILPRYWSDQFGLRIQVCGQIPPDCEVTVTRLRPHRKDVARAGVLVSYGRDGDLVGLVAVNAPHVFTAVTRAMMAAPHARIPVGLSVSLATKRHLTSVAAA
jgi:NADPH-dependent 2,4-dienoyl-CoA reductase/sulfur reductase-like enzyme